MQGGTPHCSDYISMPQKRMNSESNTPEFSVSEISGALKKTLEDRFGHICVRGEVTGYKGPHSSGHVYFDLKDENALIAAIIWKGVFGKLAFRPENGMEVRATGKISTFPKNSGYQLIIERLEPAGEGALLAMLEERKRRLTAEGLFDPARKQLLPFMPKVVAIITSPTGAVIHDMLRAFEKRCPAHIIIVPVKVQGDGADVEIARAITGVSQWAQEGRIPMPDVLIVARGGGSLEDLMCFNSEAVVRALAQCDIPTISGVGHETDTTLCDFAADVRATTPTQAVELATPVHTELVARVNELGHRLGQALRRRVAIARAELVSLTRVFPAAENVLGERRQRLDYAGEKALAALRTRVSTARGRYSAKAAGFSPRILQSFLHMRQQRLTQLQHGLNTQLRNRAGKARVRFTTTQARMRPQLVQAMLQRHGVQLGKAGQLLQVLSYKSTLARGFTVVRGAGGEVVRSAAIAHGVLTIEWADGSKDAQIIE